MPSAVFAADFVEPPVFASENGVLDLLMIAKAKTATSISYIAPGGATLHPTAWVYEICPRAAALAGNECPASSVTVARYGGVRLALQPGDKLKIRLVNRLPKLAPLKVTHSVDPGGANLPLNLTNIHTHGMIVPARAPTLSDPTFGDDVFVEIYNSANGTPVPQKTHQHGSVVRDFVDYRIDVPANHPSGAFWFHPHIHGIALDQVSGGLSGIISVGRAGDYASGDLFHARFPEEQVRHLILKDMQVLPGGTMQFRNGPAPVAVGEVQYQEDPTFCAQFPASAGEPRQGSCPGNDNSSSGGNNYTGGSWFFTVSGQAYPTIRMTEPDGELWRLTNASGSASYDLQLVDDASAKPMIMQLVSVDGVSIDVPPATALGTMMEMGGARFKVVACPPQPSLALHSAPVCISEFAMMPSSRAEVWVTYRNAAGHIVPPPSGATATFKTIGLSTGPAGDSWPAVDLAKVAFDQAGPHNLANFALDIAGDALAVNGYCTMEQWHGGQCSSVPQVVEIPFSQLGEFVYHCHILEHEDGGMMAKIRVVPAPR